MDFVKNDGKWDDLEPLLELLETDPDPMLKHRLLRLLIDNPPFERAHQHRLDRPHLVERLWMMMNQLTAYDSKLRCDLVDFYYMLYGIKKPSCLSSKEIADMLRPHKSSHHHRGSDHYGTIPKINKAQDVKRELLDGEEEEDPNKELNSFLTDKPAVVPDMHGKRKVIEYEADGDIFGSVSGGGVSSIPLSSGLKTETLDEVVIGGESTVAKERGQHQTMGGGGHEQVKKIKADNYYSDNSISLPGMTSTAGHNHPVGFEPGMFQSQQDDQSQGKVKSEKVSNEGLERENFFIDNTLVLFY